MTTPVIAVVKQDEIEPYLCVKLGASPPVVDTYRNGDPVHGKWTLDLLERTAFEFRTAGAWDESEIEFKGYPSQVICEVMANRGEDAMPWGWRPSDGRPVEKKVEEVQEKKSGLHYYDFLGDRVLHGILLTVILVLMVVR